ncbi:MAG: cation diffusion facilitator family transporter [Holosporaceae bacterium]|jgi:ferrous-iron efflux pump FieF|nr:cation diffusion facilitator family transporter [Holosporaceae bacterium]
MKDFDVFFRIKLFDRMLDMYCKNRSHTELAKQSVVFGVFISIFLIILKLGAWIITDSISMRASMTDSFLDALTSFLAYHALLFSSVSIDKEHNFGHEKVEGIMALFQCLLVIYSGIMIFVEAHEALLNPKSVNNTEVGIAVMIISCVAVYKLVYFQKYVALKTDSVLVKGDSLHYLSDFLVNICIVLSLLISKFFIYADVVCGVLVGGYVLYSAFLILKSAIVDLMDGSLPQNAQDRILKTIKSVDGVKKIKILKTRSAGMKKYIESIIKVSSGTSFVEADNITQKAESKLRGMFEKVDVIIKAEPD